MTHHLKRIPAPTSWTLDRKANVFITKPNPTGHPLENGMPLGVLLRDQLKLVQTQKEAKKLLHLHQVLVDGKRREDYRYHVGLFDVITLPDLKKHYHLVFDKKGRIILEEITPAESTHKICRVVGKVMVPGGKLRYKLHDGKNISTEKKLNIGDSVILSLPKLEVQEVLSFKSGASVYLIKGKNRGAFGKLKEIKSKEVVYITEDKEIETLKDYLFVIPEKHKSKKSE